MSDAGHRELTREPDRPSLSPHQLKDLGAGVVLAAFSSTAWLMKMLACTEAEAAQFKANAQHDFDCLMMEARRAKGMMP